MYCSQASASEDASIPYVHMARWPNTKDGRETQDELALPLGASDTLPNATPSHQPSRRGRARMVAFEHQLSHRVSAASKSSELKDTRKDAPKPNIRVVSSIMVSRYVLTCSALGVLLNGLKSAEHKLPSRVLKTPTSSLATIPPPGGVGGGDGSGDDVGIGCSSRSATS